MRRKLLSEIVSNLMDAQEELNAIQDEEQEAFDNLPESLQYSERGDSMQEAIDAMDSALDDLDSVIESINEAIGE